jgi:hypothetical protein
VVRNKVVGPRSDRLLFFSRRLLQGHTVCPSGWGRVDFVAYMVAPIHTNWPAIRVVAVEMTTVTSASLAARYAYTTPSEQTARMQQPVFSRL